VRGVYLVKLTRADGWQRWVPFVVRDDSAQPQVLVLLPTATWQAYNAWAGESLYDDQQGLMPSGHAFQVSFDRPYQAKDMQGAGDFLIFERPLVQFEGVDDANAADALVGATLAIDRADVVLAEGEYLDDDLVGCVLVDASGTTLATVVSVEHYPAQDVLLVALPGGKRGMVPMVGAFIKTIDVAACRITVDLPVGLLDDREAEQA